LRILLVDDDADFATSMADILDLEGYRVEVSHSVPDAVRKAEAFTPDVALIDIRIGTESGLDLVASLHRFNPDLTCIMVTAYADTDTAIEALKSGVYDYLRKPFETDELFSVLNRCADRHRLLAEKAASEKARTESEARFRVAFETSPDAIVLAYPDGQIIDANPGFEQMTGYRREQTIGRSSLEIGLWRNSDDRALLLEQLKSFGRVNNMESDFRLSDGSIRRGLISARVVQLSGEQVGLFVVRDIHDQRLKEAAILESEERFRGLVSNISGAVYRCDNDADFTMHYISSPIRNISGYPPGDFVRNKARSYASIIHPDDLETVSRIVAAAVENKKPFTLEYRILHADGSVRWVYEKGFAVYDAEGQVKCLDGVIFDDTDNRMAREGFAASKKQFEELTREYSAVLEGIPDAILLIDPSLRIVWGNAGASQHFNVPQENIRGMDCLELWNCRSNNFKNGIKRVFSTGLPSESIQKTPNGRVWGVKIFPVRGGAGEITSVIQIASDMTEKSRLRDQAARSAHLAALGELAAGVAHEINNPTGMMLLDLPMLKDALNDLMPLLDKNEAALSGVKVGGLSIARFRQEVPHVIDEIYEGAERIKRIVEELKDFSRPSTGEQAVVDLNEVVKKAVSLVRNPLRKATDSFSDQYASAPLLFSGNSLRMEQVLVNLLLNACYAMQDRTGAIGVETSFGKNAKTVRVVVRDEGVGVEKEVLDHITDPFFTSRRESGGTGLGLSVSSRIIDEHKGTLSFESEPGKGMIVTVELPAAGKENDDV